MTDLSFAHLSDPHLPIMTKPQGRELWSKRIIGYSNWSRRRRYQHTSSILQKITDDIAGQNPDLITLTGDVANISLPSEFDQAARWVKSLGTPENLLFVPGNHDNYVRTQWSQTLGQLSAYMSGKREGVDGHYQDRTPEGFDDFPYLRRMGSISFIGVNSSPATLPGLATGALGTPQRERLVRLLNSKEVENSFVVIMLHHPAVKGVVKRRKALDDLEAVHKIIAASKAGLVIHGHAHIPCFETIKGHYGDIPHIGVASASYAGRGEGADEQGYHPAAQYHLYTVKKNGDGFKLSLKVRGLDVVSGNVIDLKDYQF